MDEQLEDILLVEDNPNDVELTLHVFKTQNISNRVRVVRDGAEALEYLFATGRYEGRNSKPVPRVILLDLKLPLVDGLEVLRRIKADERMRLIPVVVMTSSREESDLVESYRIGVNSYVVKPVEFEQFAEAVKTLGMYWLLMNVRPELP